MVFCAKFASDDYDNDETIAVSYVSGSHMDTSSHVGQAMHDVSKNEPQITNNNNSQMCFLAVGLWQAMTRAQHSSNRNLYTSYFHID